LAQWDYDLLPLELAELQKMNVDLDLTGFSAEEILRLLEPSTPVGLTDPDDIPEPPAFCHDHICSVKRHIESRAGRVPKFTYKIGVS